jgi:AcrR family transcriptional regulator
VSSSATRSTRDAILDAAADLIRERGAGVTLEEIAERARVSRQSLYLHFGSRTSLMIAMAEHIDEKGPLDRLLKRVFGAPTPVDALDEIVALHAAYYPIIYPVARIFMSRKHDEPAMQAAWNDRMESRHRLYRGVVERLDGDGRLTPEWDVETATDILWAVTSWELWEQLTLERGWSAAVYRETVGAVLRRILVAEDARRW